MYLINIHTYKLEEFLEGQAPPYAILSHRWTVEELNYAEVYEERINRSKRGYLKLVSSCKAALEYQVEFIWNDTCCIDKKSSAELSEAINSMFRWYQNAKVCLAYLEDVTNGESFDQSFRDSKWFTRCWTLQELLASKRLVFYDRDWNTAGDKSTTLELVSAITDIPAKALAGGYSMADFTVAQRLSWASSRQATRTEDVAYSLLGILDIHMPLLYGEGSKAFRRLQEELVKHSQDLTFLFWGSNDSNNALIASSPADFAPTEQYKGLGLDSGFRSSVFTNFGLEIDAKVVIWSYEVWGVVLARESHLFFYSQTGQIPYIFLLVKREIRSDAFYRVGIAQHTFDRNDYLNSTEKRIKVFERNPIRNIVCPTPFWSIRFGYQIKTEESIRAENVNDVNASDVQFQRRDVFGFRGTPTNMEWQYEIPLFSCLASMVYKRPHSPDIYVNLSLDMDFIPCICIAANSLGLRYFDRFGVHSLSELVRLTPENACIMTGFRSITDTETGRRHHLENQCWMVPLGGGPKSHMKRAYFLRHEGERNIFFQIPEDLAPSENPLWVSLIHPLGSVREGRALCKLFISSTEPNSIP